MMGVNVLDLPIKHYARTEAAVSAAKDAEKRGQELQLDSVSYSDPFGNGYGYVLYDAETKDFIGEAADPRQFVVVNGVTVALFGCGSGCSVCTRYSAERATVCQINAKHDWNHRCAYQADPRYLTDTEENMILFMEG